MISIIDIVNEDALIVPVEERLGIEALAIVIINYVGDDIDEYDEIRSTLVGFDSYKYAPKCKI